MMRWNPFNRKSMRLPSNQGKNFFQFNFLSHKLLKIENSSTNLQFLQVKLAKLLKLKSKKNSSECCQNLLEKLKNSLSGNLQSKVNKLQKEMWLFIITLHATNVAREIWKASDTNVLFVLTSIFAKIVK